VERFGALRLTVQCLVIQFRPNLYSRRGNSWERRAGPRRGSFSSHSQDTFLNYSFFISSQPRRASSELKCAMAPLVDNPLISSATLHNPCECSPCLDTTKRLTLSSATLLTCLRLAIRYHLAHFPAILPLR